MNKKEPRKKKLEQPDPIRPPAAVYEPKKIRPHACLLLRAYTAKSQNDYLDFRVKRSYYRQLDLSLPDSRRRSREPDTTVSQLYQVYSKMKYLYRLQVKDFESKKWNFFYRTKLRRIREVKIVSYYSPSFGTDDDKIKSLATNLKKLKRLNMESLKIKIPATYFFILEIFSELVTNVILELTGMINLKEFSLVIKTSDQKERPMKNLRIKDNSSKFKKLQKLEKLSLVFQQLPRSLLDSFPQDFSYLKNLKSIKLAAVDEKHGKKIIKNLCKIKSLTSVTIYRFAEPNDILSLALEVPSLRSINIKDDWIFSSQDMPVLKTIKEKGLDINQLHVDVPLNFESSADVNFILNFLAPFKEIRSLHLHIRSGEGDKDILHPIAKSINSLQKLEKLRLGLLTRSPRTCSQFLSCIDNLKELKEVVLVMERDYQPTWDKEIKETYQSLKSFLLQSKKLKNVAIGWDNFTQKCVEHLKLIVDEMEDLDTFGLGYLTTAKYHGKVHEHVLRSLGNLFGTATTKIKSVNLGTLCPKTHNEVRVRAKRERFGQKADDDCADIALNVSKIVETNKNIIKFALDVAYDRQGGLSHPFFDKCLLKNYQ